MLDRVNENRDEIERCIHLSADIELLVSKIYRKFSWLYPEHREFWWRLAAEELDHASLMRSAVDFVRVGRLPEAFVLTEPELLEGMHQQLAGHLAAIEQHSPTLAEACEMALEMESSAAESHLQFMWRSEDAHPLVQLFRRLNQADADHGKRILEFYYRHTDRPAESEPQ